MGPPFFSFETVMVKQPYTRISRETAVLGRNLSRLSKLGLCNFITDSIMAKTK